MTPPKIRRDYEYNHLLMGLDRLLAGVSTSELDTVLETIPGLRWEDELPMPDLYTLKKTNSACYLGQKWSLPARYAWYSIRTTNPRFVVLEALENKHPHAWAWKEGVEGRLQPSVWAAAALLRDTRLKSTKVLARILRRGLQGASTPEERAHRACEILGGSLKYATELLADWGGSGWDATASWGSVQYGVLKTLLDPDKAGADLANPWCKIMLVSDEVATSKQEAEAWREGALARGVESWIPFVRIHHPTMASQESFSQNVVDEISSLDPWTQPASQCSVEVTSALETLAMEIMKTETDRGPVRIQSHNIKVLNIVMRSLTAQGKINNAMLDIMARTPHRLSMGSLEASRADLRPEAVPNLKLSCLPPQISFRLHFRFCG